MSTSVIVPSASGAESVPARTSVPPDRDGRIGWREFGLIAFQLALLLVLLRQYQIENAAFLRLAQLAFGGFLVHTFLPLRYRLPFFALLSLTGTAMLLGLANFGWMLGIGIVLIGICHLPVATRLRALLLVVVGAVLAAQRSGSLPSPWSEAIWPILGSMFMFRLIVYLHDLPHDKAPATPARTFAYFFMLPNASFPLFPVVDYAAFRRNYYDDQAYRIYQTGVDWMLRGVVHLLLYRLVYYHLTLTPAEVTSPALLLQYLVANFLLYLKVSGLFHLAVGMLYLFGFHLPETHKRYFLAAGFTDFWRRINIYWKDFLQKVFYYPAVFKLKKLGPNAAIVVATIWVFLLTWFLHAYQWFWIRGTALFVFQDMFFWFVLGVLVVVNSLFEIRHGRRRRLSTSALTWRDIGTLTVKSYATFWFICILWSFWTSDKLDDWLSVWRVLGGHYTTGVLLWPLLTLAVLFVGNIPRTKAEAGRNGRTVAGLHWTREHAITLGGLAVLIAFSAEPIFSRFGPEFSTTMHSLRSGTLSRIDTAKMERGYYESLTDVNRFNSQLWEIYAKKPRNWLDVENAGLKRFVGGFAQTELIPSFVSTTKYGTVTINRWGMRDREYAERPEPNTFRAALLGTSSLMGWGVNDGETFEALVEERLNREMKETPFARYELLNYGVPGYQPPQQMINFERALRKHLNAVVFVADGRELTRSVSYLAEVTHKGIDVPYAPLREILAQAGVAKGMTEAEAQRRLLPHAEAILTQVYGHIAEEARRHQVRTIWVFLPPLAKGGWRGELPTMLKIAKDTGFIVIDLADVFNDKDASGIRLAEWDNHPNAYGHQLIAQNLFQALQAKRAEIFSPVTAASTSSEPRPQ